MNALFKTLRLFALATLLGNTLADSVTVNLKPASAVSSGAQWRLTTTSSSGPWNFDGDKVTTGPGSFSVEFQPIFGWTAPATQNVTVKAGSPVILTATYVALPTGTLAVDLTPTEVESAGGQWRIFNDEGPFTAWNPGDGSLTLPVGDYTIQFQSNTPTWQTPTSEDFTITAATTTNVTGAFVYQGGTLHVDLSPDAVETTGGQWRLFDGEGFTQWNLGDDSLTIPNGDYTVQFQSNTPGWGAPASQNFTMTTGATIHITGAFEPISGTLQVDLAPSAIESAGGQWRVDDGETLTDWNTGDGSLTLPVGDYTVQFQSVFSWETPASQNITISAGTTTEVTATYVKLPTGSLAVDLTPTGIESAGGQWRIFSNQGPLTAWNPSDHSLTLPIGDYTIQFRSNTPTWQAPTSQDFTITAGATTNVTATFVYQGGTLHVDLSPGAIETHGGQWRVFDGEGFTQWNPGDGSLSLLNGDYTIQFRPVADWGTPVSQDFTMTTGASIHLTGTYLPQIFNYAQWLLRYPGIPPAQSGKLDDTDGDRIPNVVEMFQGSSPVDPQSGVGVTAAAYDSSGPGELRMQFNRGRNAPSNMGAVEWSTDLVTWKRSGESHAGQTIDLVEILVDDSQLNYQRLEVIAQPASGTPAKLYLRLAIDDDSV